MQKPAISSGTVMYEFENKLYLSKAPSQWVSTFLFVTGILVIILLGNGILQLTLFKNQFPGASKLAFILIGVGIIFILVFWRVWLYRKKVNAIPLHQLETICIFDFGNNNLLDSQQNIIAPLNDVWLTRKMQLTSSSPELILCWKGGSFCIIKGNPFSGGIASIEKLLLSRGIVKK